MQPEPSLPYYFDTKMYLVQLLERCIRKHLEFIYDFLRNRIYAVLKLLFISILISLKIYKYFLP